MLEHFAWAEKYRPKTLDECIFPEKLYDTFSGWVADKNIPDVVLTGSPGIGKTTVAKAVLNEIGAEWFKINGSLDGGKDTIRTDIFQFASTVSLNGGKKYVLIDESDGVTHEAQKALRGFMDEFARNCGFIFTCNYPGRIIEPIHSRTQLIEFTIAPSERVGMMEKCFKLCAGIMKAEGLPFDNKVLSQIVVDGFPDIRATINEMQRIAKRDGSLNALDNGNSLDSEITKIIGLLKERNFAGLRKWAAETHIEFHVLAKAMFDRSPEFVKNDSLAQLIILLGEYQHKAALVVDQEINTAAFLAQTMNEVEFR